MFNTYFACAAVPSLLQRAELELSDGDIWKNMDWRRGYGIGTGVHAKDQFAFCETSIVRIQGGVPGDSDKILYPTRNELLSLDLNQVNWLQVYSKA